MSSHVADRLPALRRLIAQVGAAPDERPHFLRLAEPTKAELARQRAMQADFFFAISDPRKATPRGETEGPTR